MDERFLIENEDKKEELFLIAIKNLIRKNNYSNLIIQKIEGKITKKQFDEELKNNSKKYTIEQFKLKDPTDATFIIEIYRKLEKFFKDIGKEDISLDEISEMFSVKSEQIIESVKFLKSNIKKQFNIT